MTIREAEIKRLALTVRTLSIDAIEKANSGHPGLPLGAADFASTLWANFLRFDPSSPKWPNRDRFILSAGHGCMLLYSLLHLFGYDLPMSEIQRFRQWDSKTPGHPEFGHTPGVEATTGPLGQGFVNGVGAAISGKMLSKEYGEKLFNFKVYALVSDGDLMEGITAEAASIAGHLGLDNLIYLYDDNHISLAGETKVCFTESVPDRFKSYGWNVISVDGHNLGEINSALETAKKPNGKPTIICCRTLLGFGSPNKANTHDVHGAPLGKDELKATKENLGWPLEPAFLIPGDVSDLCQSIVSKNQAERAAWEKELSSWKTSNPELAKKLDAQLKKELPTGLKEELLAVFKEPKKDATRNLSGQTIQAIAKHVPFFLGGSADLEPSTKTQIKGSKDIQKGEFSGRNMRYGVREHAMGAIANGFAYSESWIPFTATFLVFSDYMRPTIRLAALSHLQTLFVFTHDSFWVGEDGPTHEPIEHVQALRTIPGLKVYRPADGLEVAMSYYAALSDKHAPSALIFTRQNVPPLERPKTFSPDDVLKGAYVVSGADCSDLVLVATGSEVGLAVEAAKILASKGKSARVVSMPCVEAFLNQDKAYRESVVPAKAKKVSIEAGITMGWERIVGSDAILIGVDHYGASAPGELIAEKFGFTGPAIAERILHSI